jgi:hypothetical protein
VLRVHKVLREMLVLLVLMEPQELLVLMEL